MNDKPEEEIAFMGTGELIANLESGWPRRSIYWCLASALMRNGGTEVFEEARFAYAPLKRREAVEYASMLCRKPEELEEVVFRVRIKKHEVYIN